MPYNMSLDVSGPLLSTLLSASALLVFLAWGWMAFAVFVVAALVWDFVLVKDTTGIYIPLRHLALYTGSPVETSLILLGLITLSVAGAFASLIAFGDVGLALVLSAWLLWAMLHVDVEYRY